MFQPTTFFQRHGTSNANVDSIYRPEGTRLNDQGEREAIAGAKRLVSKGIKYIVSSPLPRAQKTAQLDADVLGIPRNKIIYNGRLGPLRVGAYEGLDRKENPLNQYVVSSDWEIPGGDSLDSFEERIDEVLPELISFGKSWGPILVVTHSSVLAAFYSKINNCKIDMQLFEFVPPGGFGMIDACGKLSPCRG